MLTFCLHKNMGCHLTNSCPAGLFVKENSWDVESDAMEWETAVSGIKTMRRNIEELREEGYV